MSSGSRPLGGLRIAVLGYVVRGPLGGLAWHYLQYVLGLQRLGHDVAYMEDSGDEPWSCYDPMRGVSDADPTYGLAWATDVFQRSGVGDVWAYYDAHTSSWLGPMAAKAEAFCRTADVILNISGSNSLRAWTRRPPVRAFVDTDPVFTQVRNLTDAARMTRAMQHNTFFTFGENFGTTAAIPDDGLPWRPTRQPVVLDLWPFSYPPPEGHYTTVLQWDSYHKVTLAGRTYGMKSDSFWPFVTLPSLTNTDLEMAVGSPDAPREWLRDHKWHVVDPLVVARDPWEFQRYVRESRGEVSVAKQGYVATNSGWFSERSANYLATGRPVIVQDTGFGRSMPVGAGLLPFSTLEEAVDAIDAVRRRPVHHARAARLVAEEYFDSRLVLGRLLG